MDVPHGTAIEGLILVSEAKVETVSVQLMRRLARLFDLIEEPAIPPAVVLSSRNRFVHVIGQSLDPVRLLSFYHDLLAVMAVVVRQCADGSLSQGRKLGPLVCAEIHYPYPIVQCFRLFCVFPGGFESFVCGSR